MRIYNISTIYLNRFYNLNYFRILLLNIMYTPFLANTTNFPFGIEVDRAGIILGLIKILSFLVVVVFMIESFYK